MRIGHALMFTATVATALRTPPPSVMYAAGSGRERDFTPELQFAKRVVSKAGKLLRAGPGSGTAAAAHAQDLLLFDMSQLPKHSQGAWVSHANENIVSVALVDPDDGPLIGAVCRPHKDELLFAAVGMGAWCRLGDMQETRAPQCGMASACATVVHVPDTRCPPLELALENLGEKMPVEVTSPANDGFCYDGLFELVSGRADVYISPPDLYSLGQRRGTPVEVLCAFAVLLQEVGGQMSDTDGQEIDLGAALSFGSHDDGLVASEASAHNYVLHSVRGPFSAQKRKLLPELWNLNQQ